MPDGEKERIYVLLKNFWAIVPDEILKDSHIADRTEFMWDGVNLRVARYLVQFILALPYILLSFIFWNVIIWLSMHRTTCLEYERLDVVFTKYVQRPIIKMTVVAII